MLIAAERLLVRVRQVPSRADELIVLRGRLRAERTARPGAEERALAIEMRALKRRISDRLSHVTSCATCAVGKPPPRGAFAGGDCCSGKTADLFEDHQLAALAQAGTRPRDLRPPRTVHAGCAFRGATGCTLAAEDRPARCVHYTCMTLRRELRSRGELAALDETLAELERKMKRFAEMRTQRLDDELFAPLADALDSLT